MRRRTGGGRASMRVLVAAKHVAADRTSEGLCTFRLIEALVAGGHEVRVVTVEPEATEAFPPDVEMLPEVEIVRLDGRDGTRRASVALTIDPERSTAARPLRLLGSIATVARGATPGSLMETRVWREALERQQATFAPDVIVVRGGGLGFEPHFGVLAAKLPTPWVAHLHDPWPASAYPPSYREHTPLYSRLQERRNRALLRAAPLVTFPSDRLCAWTERTSGVDLGDRSMALPHAGESTPGRPDEDLVDDLCGGRRFVLAHTGTLLGPRSPLPLLRAVDEFVQSDPERAAEVRVVLVGSLDRRHRSDPAFAALRRDLEHRGLLRVHDGRVSPATAQSLVGRATAGVVIEADDPESPFFPTKLADSLVTGRPVLALSPRASVASDLLGPDHPLRQANRDDGGVLAALETLWAARSSDHDTRVRPPPEAVMHVSAAAHCDAVAVLLSRARETPSTGSGHRLTGTINP